MRRFKLVTQDYKTRAGLTNETTWEIGKRVEAAGPPGGGLCTDSFVHCYDSPELAAFLNPMHADIDNPRMLVVETHGRGKNDCGFKRGYRSMTPVREIDCPQPTLLQRAAFGILCVRQVYTGQRWNAWADAWLSGEDRSYDSARVAARDVHAVYNAPYNAAYTAAHAAYDAAYDAARAAARGAARAATYAAAYTAVCDASCSGTLNLVAIAKQAMTY